MQEEREERTKKMAEELSKLQQIHAHLAAVEQMAASLPGESQHASGDRVSGAVQGPHGRRGRHREA
jgi:hypothetical protein